jgi:hypothetical protein
LQCLRVNDDQYAWLLPKADFSANQDLENLESDTFMHAMAFLPASQTRMAVPIDTVQQSRKLLIRVNTALLTISRSADIYIHEGCLLEASMPDLGPFSLLHLIITSFE